MMRIDSKPSQPSEPQRSEQAPAGQAKNDDESVLESVLDYVTQNVGVIKTLHERAEQNVSKNQLFVESLTSFVGQPLFFFGILAVVGLWVLLNVLGPMAGLPQLDEPPFFWLQGIVGLCALLMTTVVLITQNRQGKLAQQRAHLDLQMSLLAEQKITKLIALVEELRRDLPIVHDREDVEAAVMAQAADPCTVVEALEEVLFEAVEKEAPEKTS